MKRSIFIMLSAIVAVAVSAAGKSTVIDGIRYTLLPDQTLSCKADKKKELQIVDIPSTVRIDALDYVVSKVEQYGFMDCKNLQTITLPNTIKNIGKGAFWNCTSLESTVMPDDAVAEKHDGAYGFGTYGIFRGCKKLTRTCGTTVMYPKYLVFDAFQECEDVPFYNTIRELGSAAMLATKMDREFSAFSLSRIKDPVETWQRRKDYETMAQWETRVTEANRKAMIDEAIASARKEYIDQFSPISLSGKIEEYNSDFGFFSILTGSMGNIYAKVPESEAEAFRSSWNQVKIQPVYGILDDRLAILSCSFVLGEKVYPGANTYNEDDLSEMTLDIVPLSAVREYEQMMASGNKPDTPVLKYDIDAIDIDIPENKIRNDKTFAVIIGNENYHRVSHVDYAMNDARIFAKYCERTLGIPQTNIRTYYDATFGDIVAAVADIKEICTAYRGEAKVIFYYAGHGIPDDSSRNAFLLPIDANGTSTEVCYPLNKLYRELSDLPAESVLAFIDACFSGSLRGDGMLASARGIKLRPRDARIEGKLVVLSAASGDQSAFPYHEKNHGMFTYYLLDKLNKSAGDVSIGELADYVTEEVSKQAIVANHKPQTPNVKWSMSLTDTWHNMKLK